VAIEIRKNIFLGNATPIQKKAVIVKMIMDACRGREILGRIFDVKREKSSRPYKTVRGVRTRLLEEKMKKAQNDRPSYQSSFFGE